ncbi:MFS transporter, partial [Streptomyces clavuligerus]
IRDGLRYVARHPTLATLTLVNATIAVGVGVGVLVTLWPLYALRTLAMPGTVFGMILGAGALGAATGALLAPRLARRYGPGPMMLAALALTLLTQIPLLFAGPGAPWQTALGAAQFVHMACAGAAGVTQRTVRQLVAEPAMQARMQAVSTWLCAVARPLAVPFLALARSPLRGLRRMPPASGPADTPSAPGGERAGAAVPPPAAEPDGAAPSGTGPEGGAR